MPQVPDPTDKDVMVLARDGTRLAVDVYRPPEGGPFPALVSTSPYGKDRMRLPPGPPFPFVEAGATALYLEHGYAHVIADGRGSGKSEGRLDVFSAQEQRDGFDLIEWVAAQPWCDGSVGMIGASYFAVIQYLVAAQQPPHLKAIFPYDALSDLYRDTAYTGGIWNLGFSAMWWATTLAGIMEAPAPPPTRLEPANSLLDMLQRPEDGPYYWERSPYTMYDRIQVPVYHSGNWLSGGVHLRGLFNNFRGINAPKKLLVSGAPVSQLFFNSAEMQGEVIRWFDYWLKGEQNGITDEPPIRIFVRGSETWRSEQEWPLARTVWTKYHLRGGGDAGQNSLNNGLLSLEPPGQDEADRFDYPATVMRQLVGASVLTYQTPSLQQDLELTGPMVLVLYAATTAEDTDWIVTLRDVSPEGQRQRVTAGWLKTSHREVDAGRSQPWQPFHPHANPKPVRPGEIYRYEIEVLPTSYCFRKGHCLQIEIASSDTPLEGLVYHNPMSNVATNTVYHDRDRASYLLAPVIPQ